MSDEVAQGVVELEQALANLSGLLIAACAICRDLDRVPGPGGRDAGLAALELSRSLYGVRHAYQLAADGLEVASGHRLPSGDDA